MKLKRISIQERFAPFLLRNITPIIPGTTRIADSIGYASTIDVADTSSPYMSSCAAKIDGIKKEKDKPIANNQIFLLIDFRIGFREINRNAVRNGYAPR